MHAIAIAIAIALAFIGTASPVLAATAPADADNAKQTPEDRFRPLALTANPLSLPFKKFGFNVEYLPVVHHAIVVNPNVELWTFDEAGIMTATTYGGELGYRFYGGTRGASGVFVGPSFHYTHFAFDVGGISGLTLDTMGAALDVGGQFVGKNGFTIGGGAGIMYRTALDSWFRNTSAIGVNQLAPRLLFTMGYSF